MGFSRRPPVPSQGPTVGSNGIATGGRPMRAAAAAAASALLNLASTKLGVPAASLSVQNGVISGGGRSVTYGELIGGQLFNVKMPPNFVTANTTVSATNPTGLLVAGGLDPGAPGTKPVAKYTVVGTNVPRIDIPDKVTGKHTYVQNVRVPEMLHGRAVRPHGQGGYVAGSSAVVSVDESSIRHIPEARVVRRGNFVGVIASQEYDAIRAAAQLKVEWADPPPLPSAGNLWSSIRATPANQLVVNATRNIGNVDTALGASAKVLRATYCVADQHPRRDRPLGGRRRRLEERRHGAVSVPRRLRQAAPGDRGDTRLAGQQCAAPLLRGRQHVRAQRLRPRGSRRRDHVADRRQARSRAAHALGRARLGQLQPRRSSWT